MLFRKIAIASDHAGSFLKKALLETIQKNSWEYANFGANTPDVPFDYPDCVPQVVKEVREGDRVCGILICGSGMGMSIAANRFRGIYAALVQDVLATQMARRHNNANILVLGGRLTTPEVARICLLEFLMTPFENDRHAPRVHKIDTLGSHPSGTES